MGLSCPKCNSDLNEETETLSLYEFVKAAWAELELGAVFEDGPHIKAVCDHFQRQYLKQG